MTACAQTDFDLIYNAGSGRWEGEQTEDIACYGFEIGVCDQSTGTASWVLECIAPDPGSSDWTIADSQWGAGAIMGTNECGPLVQTWSVAVGDCFGESPELLIQEEPF